MGIHHEYYFRVELRSYQKEDQMATVGAFARGSHCASRRSGDVMRPAILDLSHFRSGFCDLRPHW